MAKLMIGIVGVPSAGKSTLARALSGLLREHTKFNTIELVDEYARTYIHKYGIEDISDQFMILDKQYRDEEEYPKSIDVLVTDSPIFLSFPYAISLQKDTLRDAKILSEIFQKMVKYNIPRRYDIIFHLSPGNRMVRDGVRKEEQFDFKWREAFNQEIINTFKIFKPHCFHEVKSELVSDRVLECITLINKYCNISELKIT